MLRRFTTLVLAEQSNTRLLPNCLSAITAGSLVPGGLHILVAGHQVQQAASHAASIKGVNKVLHCEAEKLGRASGGNDEGSGGEMGI